MRKTGLIVFVFLFCGTAIWMIIRNQQMKRTSTQLTNRLYAGLDTTDVAILENEILSLPLPVQRYLNYTLNGKRHHHHIVHFKHAGWIQINMDSNFYDHQKWKYLIAENRVRLDRPAFFWQGMIDNVR